MNKKTDVDNKYLRFLKNDCNWTNRAIAAAIPGTNMMTVSRWCQGASISEEYALKLKDVAKQAWKEREHKILPYYAFRAKYPQGLALTYLHAFGISDFAIAHAASTAGSTVETKHIAFLRKGSRPMTLDMACHVIKAHDLLAQDWENKPNELDAEFMFG